LLPKRVFIWNFSFKISVLNVFIPFYAAIIQPETSFVKQFFQLFFITRDKSLCVNGEKKCSFWKKFEFKQKNSALNRFFLL